MNRMLVAVALAATSLTAATAAAKDAPPPVVLAKCEANLGTIALVDGDTQGWTKLGLSSPRDLVAALATDSGCFTPYMQGSSQPATFLMNIAAGDKEEIDRGMSLAGNAGKAVGNRLIGGLGGRAFGGLMGGLGGHKKTMAAAIRMISPASGQTLVTGVGEVTQSTITINGLGTFGGTVASSTQASGYATSKDGQMMAEAFIKAFNAVTAQGGALAAMAPAPVPATAPAAGAAPTASGAPAITAVDAKMYAAPDKAGAVVRNLRPGAQLLRTGQKQGLFVEVDDGFGTKGWVSVEDLK